MSTRIERWAAREVLRITGRTFDAFDVVVVQLGRAGVVGQGEAMGVYYLGDTADSVLAAVESVRGEVERGIGRDDLLQLLPAGGARHALDSALWDLQAKTAGVRVWELAGVAPRALRTQMTIGIEPSAEATGQRAAALREHAFLKVKVDDDDPVGRVRAVRTARPDARITVDANQAWTLAQLQAYAPALAALDVHMIEQPLPRGRDDALASYRSPVPLYADESCLHAGELDHAALRYQGINIKLDKVGGLTAGLALADDAHRRGLGVMVGCMGGTSLSMAPAHVLACACEITDLDGPLWLRCDRLPAIDYDQGHMPVFGPEVWG